MPGTPALWKGDSAHGGQARAEGRRRRSDRGRGAAVRRRAADSPLVPDHGARGVGALGRQDLRRGAARARAARVRWYCDEEPPAAAARAAGAGRGQLDPSSVDIVFTRGRERRRARARAAVSRSTSRCSRPRRRSATRTTCRSSCPASTSSTSRLIDDAAPRRGWKGFVAPLPNCTTMGMVITLKPLLDAFGVKRVFMTSMQGLSGAGRSPGVVALDIARQHHPVHPGEEEKVAKETGKILGASSGGAHRAAPIRRSAPPARAPRARGPHRGGARCELERDAQPRRRCARRWRSSAPSSARAACRRRRAA